MGVFFIRSAFFNYENFAMTQPPPFFSHDWTDYDRRMQRLARLRGPRRPKCRMFVNTMAGMFAGVVGILYVADKTPAIVRMLDGSPETHFIAKAQAAYTHADDEALERALNANALTPVRF